MIHRLHNHPRSERVYRIPYDKEIVDQEFAGLFSKYEVMENKPDHIIVSREEFDEYKQIEKIYYYDH